MRKSFNLCHSLLRISRIEVVSVLMLLTVAFSHYSLADAVARGKTLSTYIEQQLKDKPIADYKIPEKDASVTIDISQWATFSWDKAIIFGPFDFQQRICFLLALDEDECLNYRFNELVRTGKYFIVFSEKHKVVYTEVFDDAILLFGRNTIGIERTPDKPTITAYRDITVKYRREQAQFDKYLGYALMIVLPICGVIFGLKFPRVSMVIAILFAAPMALVTFGLATGAGNPIGWAALMLPAFTSLFMGIAMFIAAMYAMNKKPAVGPKEC